MNGKILKVLMSEVNKACKKDEIPVGALIVRNDKIISKAHNKKELTKDVTAHAEILAIKKAAKKLKDWRLDDCTLYVTLEPCDMCKEVIKQSRIKETYFILKSTYNEKNNFNAKYININNKKIETDYHEVLKKYFAKKRNK